MTHLGYRPTKDILISMIARRRWFSFTHSPLVYVITFYSVLAVAFAVYVPGLTGMFLLDDPVRIGRMGDFGGITDLTSLLNYINTAWTGPLGRPLGLLSFLIDHNTWPAPAEDFKYTNVLFHLLNGCLLFALLLQILRLYGLPQKQVRTLALFVAAAWLLHPLLVSTTLYAVQRMTLLATTAVFLGLLGYIAARQQLPQRPWPALGLMTLALGGAGCVGFLFKEIAALIVPLTLVLEATLLPAVATHTVLFKRWRTVVLVVPMAALAGYLLWRGIEGIGGFDGREFGSIERLLTQARLLLQYLFFWFVPQSATPGLFNDNVTVSRSLFQPLTTLFAVISVLALASAAFLLRRRFPLLAAAVGFFFAGHLLESTTIPLELYFEHRNYLPSALLWLPIGALCLKLIPSPRPSVLVLALLVAVLASITHMRASTWGDPGAFAITAVQQNPTSQRAHTRAAIAYNSTAQHDAAVTILTQGLERRPNNFAMAAQLAIQKCRSSGVDDGTLDRLRDNARTHNYVSRNYRILEILFEESQRRSCPEMRPELVHDLLTTVLDSIATTGPDVRHRQIHHLLGMLDLQRDRLCQAYERFQRSAQASPLPGLVTRQANQLGRAGLHIEALLHIPYIAEEDQHSDRGWRPFDSGLDKRFTQATRDKIAEAWKDNGEPPIRCAPVPTP